MATDAERLRAIQADLASASTDLVMPVLTPAQQKQSNEIFATELAKAESVECIPHSAQVAASKPGPPVMSTIPGSVASQPAPAAPVEELAETARVRPARLFLTGLPGTGIMQLLQDVSGARILNLRGFVNETIKSTCSLIGDPAAETIAEFRAFGDGQFKPTLSYLFFLGLLRKNFADFGTPGFWVRKAIEALDAGPSGQQIVVGLRTSAEFKALQEAGFTHYHVMCTATLARQRASQLETVSGLAPALDADVQQKISMKRNGPRLNVVWNDTIAPLSTRFVSVETFRKEVVGIDQSMVESDQVQIL